MKHRKYEMNRRLVHCVARRVADMLPVWPGELHIPNKLDDRLAGDLWADLPQFDTLLLRTELNSVLLRGRTSVFFEEYP